jgi:senataxin
MKQNMSLQLLASATRKSSTEQSSNYREITSRIIGIHADILIAVAFASSYNDPQWQNARSKVRELISSIFLEDLCDMQGVIHKICKSLGCTTAVPIPIPVTRNQLWNKAYKTLQATDADGLRTIISWVSRAVHIDNLNEKAYSPASHPLKESKAVEKAVQEVNTFLGAIHHGFLDAMSRYADSNNSSSVLDMLRLPGVVKDVMMLMLSPVEDLQVASQTLVGQAFDVDVRLDCFRALLENLPDASLDGIFEFLELFIKYAPIVPEACNVSKSLVRCLTDIIEVLCASHDGLLRSHHYLNPTGRASPKAKLPRFWRLMSRSITVIFKRTSLWANYYESEDMIVWMRDALIFGRDMLSQRRVIEAAAIRTEDSGSLQSPKKLSSVGRRMVEDLQDVLPELARWLRLTDQELLHQSFSLLQSLLDCFRETGVPPSPIGIKKLVKHINDARRGGPTERQTRLDSSRLSKLEDSLASFVADDDELEIISGTLVQQRETPSERRIDDKPPTGTGKPITAQDPKQKVTPLAHIPLTMPSTSSTSSGKTQQRSTDVLPLPKSLESDKLSSVGTSRFPTLPSTKRQKENGSKFEGSFRVTSAPESASDSETDDDTETQGGLAALAKFQRSPKIKRPVERRQIKVLDDYLPARRMKSIQDRREDARRTALRLKPDISGLHRVLLSWDYDHPGPEPPVFGTRPVLTRVPDNFNDYNQYRQVFEPLLFMECWSQIVQSKDEPNDSFQIKITSRQFIDDWLDLEITVIDSVKKEWYLTETDIVLLRHLDRKKCILAKARSYTARPWGIQGSLRCFLGTDKGDPGLHINSIWRLSKVFR